MDKIKTPEQKCRERNRVLRRKLFQWQEQAAKIGNLIGCSSVDIEEHITNLFNTAADQSRVIEELTAELKQLREFVGAMRPGSAIFTKGGAILCGGDGNWYTDHHGKFDSAIDAYRKMKAGEGE